MEDDCWDLPEIGWPGLRVHPSHILDADDRVLVELYQMWRGGGYASGPLPFAGGAADQPACVMAAFAVMAAAERALKPEKEEG